jgi:hypothetical protein
MEFFLLFSFIFIQMYVRRFRKTIRYGTSVSGLNVPTKNVQTRSTVDTLLQIYIKKVRQH